MRFSNFLKECKKNKAMFLMLLPGFIFVFINNYIPMFGIVLAFKDFNYMDRFASPWVGFQNFRFLFMSEAAWRITRNTIGYNLLFIVLNLVIAVAVAVALNELRNRFFAKLYQSVIFLPYFLSWVIIAYLVYAILSPNGLFNMSIAPLLGVDSISWYTNPQYWPFILPLVNVWKGIGYGIVIYLAGISGIDQSYYEVAVLDGASKWQQVKSITIPLLAPMMVVTTILALGNIFRSDFGLFYQIPMQQGLLQSTTDVLDTYIFNSLKFTGDIAMSSAAGFYQSIVGFIVVLSANLLIGKISPDNRVF
ncbi:MAG: ABC transporter permease subunit [Clostridiales bacterium]|jgi:putative aldouronate transport system permease protein|nr:ABC transporter permease subunit [Clostridiales bacterium]